MAVAFLCVGLSGVATAPFFFLARADEGARWFDLRMPVTHDMHLHFEQMKSFYNGLAAGEVYPRWEEDTNRGFGAPTTSYYPPGIYYLTSAFYALTKDWMQSLLNAHLLMMIASAAAIYCYARQTMSRAAAATALAAYVLLPYHLLDQYQRAALAELLGFVWMPLMLLFGERLFRKEEDLQSLHGRSPSRLASLAGLAASYGAFLWSHTPTAYQFTLAFGVFMVFAALISRDWKGLLLACAAMALGVALSAAYLYPAALEQDLIHHEYISETWPYHATYVFLHDLPYSGGHRGFFNLIDGIWIFGAAIIACATVLLAFKPRALGLTRGLKQRLLLWCVIGGVATFMMTKYSYPLGRLIPKIDIGVFTWRMLSITTLVAALIAGASVQAVINALKLRRRLELVSFGSLALLITAGGAVFSVAAVIAPMYRAPMFVPSREHVNFATIPATAPDDPFDLPEVERAVLEGGKGEVFIERWDPEHRALRVDLSEHDRLLIRTFNFPGWTAVVDGQRAEITNGRGVKFGLGDDNELVVRESDLPASAPLIDGEPAEVIGSEQLGDIVLELPAGPHYVTLDFLDTPPRRAGKAVTLASLLIVFGLFLLPFVRRPRAKEVGGDSKLEKL